MNEVMTAVKSDKSDFTKEGNTDGKERSIKPNTHTR